MSEQTPIWSAVTSTKTSTDASVSLVESLPRITFATAGLYRIDINTQVTDSADAGVVVADALYSIRTQSDDAAVSTPLRDGVVGSGGYAEVLVDFTIPDFFVLGGSFFVQATAGMVLDLIQTHYTGVGVGGELAVSLQAVVTRLGD